jgi:4-hydroxybenzoate polyprenyltransferase
LILRFLQMTWLPLWERFRRGEGALLLVNAALAAFTRPSAWTLGGAVALSGFVLATAYAVNDWRDAENDRRNPKKNKRLVEAMLEWRRPFLGWLGAVHVGLVAFAFVALGARSALAVAIMLGINFLYSWWGKGKPMLDLVVVGAWGASYAAIVASDARLCASVGLMTAMMHVFQMHEDRAVDAANEVSTTAVQLPHLITAALGALCAGLAAVLYEPLGPLAAASAFVPLGLRLGVADTGRAWMACRVYCGLALVAALWSLHGPP